MNVLPLACGVGLLVAIATPTVVRSQAAGEAPLGLDGRRIAVRTDTLRVRFVQGSDTTETGMIVDAISVEVVRGRHALVRVYQSNDRLLGTRRDSIVDARSTLRPIAHVSVSTRSQERLEFAADRVTGTVTLASGEPVAVDKPLAAGLLNSSSFDLALRSAPLAAGWGARFMAFVPSTRETVTLRARVSGVDTIGGRACWRVEAEFTGLPVSFWIDQADRRLCRQVMTPRVGLAIIFERNIAADSGAQRAI